MHKSHQTTTLSPIPLQPPNNHSQQLALAWSPISRSRFAGWRNTQHSTGVACRPQKTSKPPMVRCRSARALAKINEPFQHPWDSNTGNGKVLSPFQKLFTTSLGSVLILVLPETHLSCFATTKYRIKTDYESFLLRPVCIQGHNNFFGILNQIKVF